MEGDLESRLKAHSNYFASMMELIPAKFYVIKEDLPDDKDGEGGGGMDSKFWVNKRARAPKQAVKEATKKAKRLKLDPASHKKSSERNQEEDDGNDSGVVGGARGGASGSSVEKSHEQGGVYGNDGEGEERLMKRHPKAGAAVSLNGFSVERVQSGDLSDLRERLHSKIAALRGKRKLTPNEGEEGESSSQGISDKRRKIVEKRQQKKVLKKKGKEHKQVTKREKHSAGGNHERPSIKDESGRVVFSKFDFGTPAVLQSEPKPKSKDYKKLLAKAEAAQKKLDKLKEVDEKKSEELQEKLQWQRAVEMAKGTKIRDDTKRLKKTVKRLDSKKAKSRKQWMERQKQETQAKEKRQEKRKKNIQERIDQAKAKKLKKRGGKSRRPGF